MNVITIRSVIIAIIKIVNYAEHAIRKDIKMKNKDFLMFVIEWVLTIVILISLVCFLIISIAEDSTERLTYVNGYSVYTFEDPETGVWYLYSRNSGITPRLNEDGTLYEEE